MKDPVFRNVLAVGFFVVVFAVCVRAPDWLLLALLAAWMITLAFIRDMRRTGAAKPTPRQVKPRPVAIDPLEDECGRFLLDEK